MATAADGMHPTEMHSCFEWHWLIFFNNTGKVMIIRLSNGQNPCYCSPNFDLKFWTTSTPNPWVKVINYFCELGRDLTWSKCTSPVLETDKNDPGIVLCIVFVTIPWAWQPSLIKFHSIDKYIKSISFYESVHIHGQQVLKGFAVFQIQRNYDGTTA